MNYLSIKHWAADDRPREKLLVKGVQSLSDAELLGILIGSGTSETSAVELGRQLMAKAGNNLAKLARLTWFDLIQIKGIGRAKAVTLLAAMEIGRRRGLADLPESNQVTSSRDVFILLSPALGDLVHEEFWILYLNRSNKSIEQFKCSQGGVSGTVIDVKLILKKALEVLASSLILVHNHPSGNLMPSENDKQITLKVKEAAGHLDIKVLDHLIIAGNGYFSFADEGLL